MIILELVLSVTKNILTALYEYFWLSLLMAFIVSVCYLFVFEKNTSGQGLKKTFKLWLTRFRTSSTFRILFFLCFYTIMIFFRTVLNRNLWLNPLNNMFGGWWIYQTDSNGKITLTTDCLENIALFIPFSFLSLWFLSKRHKTESIDRLLIKNLKYAAFVTIGIESAQLFLRVGTFQISDMVYNFCGGIIGSLLFWTAYKLFHKAKK